MSVELNRPSETAPAGSQLESFSWQSAEEEAAPGRADHRRSCHSAAEQRYRSTNCAGQRGFSDAAFYGWRATFDGMQVDDAERLKTLEGESVKLEKPPAEALLDAEELKAALLGKP